MESHQCNPLDTYCFTPTKGDDGMIKYYAQNTGIPGYLNKKPIPTKTPFMKNKATLQDMFTETQELSYASADFARFAQIEPVLNGPEIRQYDLDDMGFGEATYFLEQKKEKCGCGATSKLKI